MAYKDIMVYLDPTVDSSARLRLAVAMARDHGARLTGAEATADAGFAGAWGETARQVRFQFQAVVKEAGLESRFVAGAEALTVGVELSHCVDLIVASRSEGEARALIRPEIPDAPLLGSGAPMLLLPPDWKPAPVGESIVVAWNGSREATRAVHDAMPLLVKAKKVTLFSFAPRSGAKRSSSAALADHLSRHGVTAGISDWIDTRDLSALEALFASLDTQDADLIVSGAFGHSRLFEGLFGSVSRDLLRQPTTPILMSH
jgi:nucleotide-binding universal stress UspA family protein